MTLPNFNQETGNEFSLCIWSMHLGKKSFWSLHGKIGEIVHLFPGCLASD